MLRKNTVVIEMVEIADSTDGGGGGNSVIKDSLSVPQINEEIYDDNIEYEDEGG